ALHLEWIWQNLAATPAQIYFLLHSAGHSSKSLPCLCWKHLNADRSHEDLCSARRSQRWPSGYEHEEPNASIANSSQRSLLLVRTNNTAGPCVNTAIAVSRLRVDIARIER